MKKLLFILALLIGGQTMLSAQDDFYSEDNVQEIRIYFEQANWDHLLDSFYIFTDGERLLASVEINGTLLDSVGIRYKGFSSVSVDREKNPFNIKLDYVKGNQTYDGINKIKLSNVFVDPSFLRETMSYEIARKYMPAGRANYANVFINDALWGLYTNVEAVNKDFLVDHFGSNNNSFFKCNPATLNQSGENSNLSNSPGTDTTDYYPYYDMRSDDGWGDLYELIDILNESPTDIESILNVDRTLWMHAFNYALVNFDSYVGFSQNYYLYQDDNGRFNPILWDLNMSFSSFRLTDASDFFDGFSPTQAKTIDPLSHYNSVSVLPRPLMRKLFENETYRRMYLAHMRTIIEENFENQWYADRGLEMQTLIDSYVENDTHKFYTYQEFVDNLTINVFNLYEFSGLTELMDDRTEYLLNYPGFLGAPLIDNIDHTPAIISMGDDLWITAEVANANDVVLAYRYGGNGLFTKINMLDDGTQNDGASGDGIYGIQLNDVGNAVQYYIYAENSGAGRFAPQRAAYEYYTIFSKIGPQDLVINEFLAANQSVNADEYGDYDDWIEIYNTSDFDISTAGLYLTDDLTNIDKWALPDRTIAPDDYLLVWADEDGGQGDLHANFKLSSSGETIQLAYADSTVIDSISYSLQIEDMTTGRYPNGTGPFVEMFPTPEATNSLTVAVVDFSETSFSIFPNPTYEEVFLKFENGKSATLHLRSADGRLLQTHNVSAQETLLKIDLHNYPVGLYYIQAAFDEAFVIKKIIISK